MCMFVGVALHFAGLTLLYCVSILFRNAHLCTSFRMEPQYTKAGGGNIPAVQHIQVHIACVVACYMKKSATGMLLGLLWCVGSTF